MKSNYNLEECLENLQKNIDRKDLRLVIKQLFEQERNIGMNTSVFDTLLSLIDDSKSPPLNRWSLVEFLTTIGAKEKYPDIKQRVLDSVYRGLKVYSKEERDYDEFVLGCTINLRLLRIPEEKKQDIANLMREQINRTFNAEVAKGELEDKILKDSLMVLGSYGNEEDITGVLTLIRLDENYRIFSHTIESLRRLVKLNYENINPETIDMVRTTYGDLLKKFSEPDETNNSENFYRTSLVIKNLCSIIEPEDISLALDYVNRAKNYGLAHIMTNDLKDSVKEYEHLGFTGYVTQRKPYIEEVYKKLNEIEESLKPKETTGKIKWNFAFMDRDGNLKILGPNEK